MPRLHPRHRVLAGRWHHLQMPTTAAAARCAKGVELPPQDRHNQDRACTIGHWQRRANVPMTSSQSGLLVPHDGPEGVMMGTPSAPRSRSNSRSLARGMPASAFTRAIDPASGGNCQRSCWNGCHFWCMRLEGYELDFGGLRPYSLGRFSGACAWRCTTASQPSSQPRGTRSSQEPSPRSGQKLPRPEADKTRNSQSQEPSLRGASRRNEASTFHL